MSEINRSESSPQAVPPALLTEKIRDAIDEANRGELVQRPMSSRTPEFIESMRKRQETIAGAMFDETVLAAAALASGLSVEEVSASFGGMVELARNNLKEYSERHR